MKKVALLATLIFSVMFSSASYAEWTKVTGEVGGDNLYVDFDSIRIVDGYVFYWILKDYILPIPSGYLSDRTYAKGDCKLFRRKWLSIFWHREPMGGGNSKANSPLPKVLQHWVSPSPHSTFGIVLKAVCDHVK